MKTFKQFLTESDKKFGLTKVLVVTKNGHYEFKILKKLKRNSPL